MQRGAAAACVHERAICIASSLGITMSVCGSIERSANQRPQQQQRANNLPSILQAEAGGGGG